jgi:hypothetical protein
MDTTRSVNISSHNTSSPTSSHNTSSTELKKESPMNFLKSMDQKTMIMMALLGVSIGASVYLYKDLKKTKEELSKLGNDAMIDELIEKSDTNAQNIHTIELKLDQLIKTIGQKTQAQQVQDQQIKQLLKLKGQNQSMQQGQNFQQDPEETENANAIKI